MGGVTQLRLPIDRQVTLLNPTGGRTKIGWESIWPMRGILENSGSNDLRDAVRRDVLVEDCSKRIIELSDERALVGSGVIPQRLGPLHEHFVGIGSEDLHRLLDKLGKRHSPGIVIAAEQISLHPRTGRSRSSWHPDRTMNWLWSIKRKSRTGTLQKWSGGPRSRGQWNGTPFMPLVE